jgi:hypothetical protein
MGIHADPDPKYRVNSVGDPKNLRSMFLGLPDPDPLVRDTDPSIIKQKYEEKP